MKAGETLWFILYLSIGANVNLWVYFRRKARKGALAIFRTVGDPLSLVVAWVWAAPFYLTMIVYFLIPSWMRWATIETPGWVQTTGALAAMLTPFLSWWVLRSLGNNFAEAFVAVFNQELVTHGPYKYVRHPLYALGCIFLVSISLLTCNWIIFAYACSGIMSMRYMVIPREEEYLMERFGKCYEDYRNNTGMLVPKLVRFQTRGLSGEMVDRSERQ